MVDNNELRDIPGFPSYKITRDGRIWSKVRIGPNGRQTGGKWLSQFANRRGYRYVSLRDADRYVNRRVHRLVLETFVGPCPECMECCHNNGNPSDNRLENLRWDTHSANARDAVKHGTAVWVQQCGEKHPKAKLTEEEVRWIDYQCRAGVPYKDIAWAYNTSEGNVSRIAQHKRWKHLWT
jgi:hypothetical protein